MPFDMSLPYFDYPLPVWCNILELLFFNMVAADIPTLLEGSYFSLVNADLLGKSAEFFSMAILASLPWYSFRTEMNVLLIRMFFIGTFFLTGDGVLTLFAKLLLETGWRWSYIYVLWFLEWYYNFYSLNQFLGTGATIGIKGFTNGWITSGVCHCNLDSSPS